MSPTLPAGVAINAPLHPRFEEILTSDALAFVAKLHRAFEPRRQELLKARIARQTRINAGEMPDFLPETTHIRGGDWRVAPLPKALECRRVEITGPVERKMIINAFNSGADSYMTDFEDSNSPNWFNQIQGQVNLYDAIRRTISYTNDAGKVYKLNDTIATLQIRPRGWHLDEKHVTVGDCAVNHVSEPDPPAAGGAGAVAGRAHELELGWNVQGSQQVGREDGRAFENDEQHERRFDIRVGVRDVPSEAAHAPGDAGRADHGLSRTAGGSRFGLCQHFRHALLA